MKRILKTTLAMAVAVALAYQPVQAQLAKQDLTMDQINKAINDLARKDDEASKAQLKVEADALAKAKNEEYNQLAARLYSFLGDEASAKKITDGLAKKYPRGFTARNKAMQELFADESGNVDAKIKAYRAWLKKFPASSFPETDRRSYVMAASSLAKAMIDANRPADAVALVGEFEGTGEYYGVVAAVGPELTKAGHHAQALAILEEAARAIKQETARNRTHDMVLGHYAQALLNDNKAQEGVALVEELIANSGRYVSPNHVLMLSQGYSQLGRKLDAFQALEQYVIYNSVNADVLAALEPLYKELNNNASTFATYRTALDGRIKKALKDKCRADMITKDAPKFTLTNMQGETVSLDDYRGKIVILDFWATWCGPCIMSFPGMQAAVNKYKNDPEVEFLFVNTWQSEDNYKDLVTEFIQKNNYSFHVVYDEMKERDKAVVTAYGVRGIPTKVFIDQEGKIRFQSAGGSADVGTVVGEMDAKIELIREAQQSSGASE